MAEENCQAADGLMGIISQTKIEETEDTEKALRLVVNLLGAFLRGEQGIDAIHAARTLLAINQARLQRTRCRWQEATTFERIRIEAGQARERMSEFVRGEIERRNGQ